MQEFQPEEHSTTPPSRLSKCLKGILYVFNVCLFIMGVAAVGIGVWLYINVKLQHLSVFLGPTKTESLSRPIPTLTALGSLTVVVALLGIIATYRGNKYALTIYGVLVFMILLAFGLVSLILRPDTDTLMNGVKEKMKDTLIEYYGVDIDTNPENRRITEAWDYMQSTFECCGVSGGTNSTDSWVLYRTSTLWYNIVMKTGDKMQKVPDSCCRGDTAICTGETYWAGPPNYFNSHREKFRKVNPFLSTTGCYGHVKESLSPYSTIVPMISPLAFMLFSALFGIPGLVVTVWLLILMFTKRI